jgi:pimeloyl-ACP methyl ester carboxylesterase
MLALAASTRAQDAPALVGDAGRTVSSSMGGSGQALTIESAILGQTRHIGLVLPPSFARSAADRRYPVIIVFDGEYNLAPVAAVCEQLAGYSQIPEAVIVAIENEDPYDGRVHDLTPPGLSVSGSSLHEGGDEFIDFIERELLAAVDRQFKGGAPRVLVGHSSGGILATWAAATRPAFAAVVSIDAPMHLGENWLPQRLLERAADKPAPLRYAVYEARFPWPDALWSELQSAAPRGWRLHRERLAGEKHETLFLLAAYLGLREVFTDYSRLSAPEVPTTSILPYYDKVSADFGVPLVPPAGVLRVVTEDLLMEGRGAAARLAFDALVRGYGAPADADELLARIAEVEQRPPPTETVESLLATPFPSPEEAAPWLGEWVGDTWMNPDEPRTGSITLRIRVVDGAVKGETIYHMSEDDMVRAWEYMQVTPAGLTWGYMNGMRPRGVLVFEGVLADGVLSGENRFGGIDFRPPKGMEHPPIRFEFRRAGG